MTRGRLWLFQNPSKVVPGKCPAWLKNKPREYRTAITGSNWELLDKGDGTVPCIPPKLLKVEDFFILRDKKKKKS